MTRIFVIRPEKRCFLCPFPTNPKYQKIRVDFFFFFFFFLILNFIFLNKNVKIKCQNIIVTAPKRNYNQIITLQNLCFGDCFGPRYFSSGAALPQKNTSVQNNHLRFHTMTSKKMVRSYCCLGLNIMEYNTFQYQDQTNSEVLHAQEY